MSKSKSKSELSRNQSCVEALPGLLLSGDNRDTGDCPPPTNMSYYALFYHVVDDYVARRAPFREEHLRLAEAAHRRGELILGGAFSNPADGALLVFRAPDSSLVEEFIRADPYVTHGLVTRWEIRPWSVVIGKL